MKDIIVYLIPLVILELALVIPALIHVLKHDRYKFGNKPLWTVVVLFIQIIGPIVYFILGKEED
ncbi:PLD nuclease N-terminal domain-containing protein [[Clostridium] polysaccharolyticum]|uniref:Phospholipase_D-nuclease N-terminal n=1 Tax=[Clostridium] polysaccharolyticum TaxID=29364 RepID=A0A1I0DQU3_9FIRM|nr:PLD nuclease N-terminal domain-containing protein [[Clostridium] polysaccharolyticum]SET34753.1 Phospholipase_D-nuclease N-terminal [[Clostridium] polysaccharolyticum]